MSDTDIISTAHKTTLPERMPVCAGWPSINDGPKLGESMPDGSPWPRITLITPTLNQAEFIEQTIRSVLMQGYPNLEYVIIDGGSTDATLDIIRKYEQFLSGWVSEPDNGPAHAINKGLAMATGEWFNWLNSDDYLLPGALSALATVIRAVPESKWISGVHLNVTREGICGSVTWYWKTNPSLVPLGIGPLPQDATFIRLDFLREHELKLNEEIETLFDTVLYRELLKLEKPVLTTAVFTAMRWYPEQITSSRGTTLDREAKEFVEPFTRDRPLGTRIMLRLLRTRLHPLIAASLLLAAHYGIAPAARGWKACVYNPWHLRFEVVDVRRLLVVES